MIILDTNVLSEPMKADSDAGVATWLDRQIIENLYITTINLAELLLGIELMPLGKRRSGLEARINEVVALFGSRILAFDTQAARYFGVLVARARSSGFAISTADGQIAAIAASRGFAVATRDTAPFIAAGVAVIDPWDRLTIIR